MSEMQDRTNARRDTRPPLRSVTLMVVALALATASACSPQGAVPDEGGDLSCGSGPRFSVSDLAKPPTDPVDDGPGQALAAFLTSREAAFAKLPRGGWIRISSTSANVLFGARSLIPDAPLAMVVLRREADRWVPETWGSCTPRSGTAQAGPATWDLAAQLDRQSTTLEVLVSELDCSSGTPAGDRILPPNVVYDEKSVTITFWVAPFRTSEDAVTCIGPPPTALRIVLPEPVGERLLLDGGTLPSRAVHVATPDADPGAASPGPMR